MQSLSSFFFVLPSFWSTTSESSSLYSLDRFWAWDARTRRYSWRSIFQSTTSVRAVMDAARGVLYMRASSPKPMPRAGDATALDVPLMKASQMPLSMT